MSNHKRFDSDKNLQNFIDQFDVPVFVDDNINVIKFYNKSFKNLFSSKLIIGKSKIYDLCSVSTLKINANYKLNSDDTYYKIIEYTNEDIKKIKFRVLSIECLIENNNEKYLINFLLNETSLISELKFLQKERLIFYSLLKNLTDAVFIKDKNGNYIYVNKSFCYKIGLNEEDILYKNDKDIFGEVNPELYLEEKEITEKRKTVVNKVEKISYNVENISWYLTSKYPLVNDEDRVIGIIGISKDITDYKNLQKENERLYSFKKLISQVSTIFLKNTYSNFNNTLTNVLKELYSFFEAVYVAIYQLNEKVYQFEKISEYPLSPIKLKLNNISDYTNWYDELNKGQFVYKEIKDCDPLEKNYFEKNNIEKLYIIPLFNYSAFTGFIVIHLPFDANSWAKEFPSMINILSEIISNSFSNNEAEKFRLEAEEEMLKLLRAVNQSTDAILILDKNFTIEYANNIYSAITGIPFEDLLGNKPAFLTDEVNIKWNNKKVFDNLKNGIAANAIYKGKKSSGDNYWGKISISPIKNFHGEITNYLVLIEDVTEKMIADTRREVSQKLESIGQLSAGIAHEINTPMQYIGDNNKFIESSIISLNNFIRELSEEIQNQNLNNDLVTKFNILRENYDIDFLLNEIPSAIKQTEEGIKRVTTIIKAMKDFAHPGNKQMAYADINRGIEVTATISKNEWKYYSDLKLELDKNLPLVYCLIDEINQVILNMIINSAHAIEEKFRNSKEKLGIIKISTTQEGDYVLINISDNGNGINPTIINRIFDPFFTTKEVGKGTGQGLSIAHDIIVNKHKGLITVKSDFGIGTTFTIKLPIDEIKNGG
ncbi:MAG: PAS domain S-box protein [Melioribacteraceae bacterium]|nr:PAS domain S-box protein [Melioribacteraceae bacterium]